MLLLISCYVTQIKLKAAKTGPHFWEHMAIHLDISSKFSNQGKYFSRHLGQWHENLVLVIWNNWVVTFRENHIVWLRIQDTRISYLLIARNPRLKTQTVQNEIVLLVFLLLGVSWGLREAFIREKCSFFNIV